MIVIRPDAILEAADRGIRNLLIPPGGFAEAGPAGVARNEAFLKLAAERGLTIAGPNCAGIIHLDPARRFAATLLRDLPPGAAAGATNGLAFISQSGALAEEFIDKANARGLPLVSVGNALHLGVEDYLGWLGDPAGDRRRAALCRIDRGSRTLPRGRPTGLGDQAGDRAVPRPHRDRRPRRDLRRPSRHRGTGPRRLPTAMADVLRQ